MEPEVIVTVRVPLSLRRQFQRRLKPDRKASPLIQSWIENWLATGDPGKAKK